PERLRHTRQFANGRRVSTGQRQMSRLYVAESTPTVTGSMADHRLPFESGSIEGLARHLAAQLGAGPQHPGPLPPPEVQRWIAAVARDLRQHSGAGIVIAGEW